MILDNYFNRIIDSNLAFTSYAGYQKEMELLNQFTYFVVFSKLFLHPSSKNKALCNVNCSLMYGKIFNTTESLID